LLDKLKQVLPQFPALQNVVSSMEKWLAENPNNPGVVEGGPQK